MTGPKAMTAMTASRHRLARYLARYAVQHDPSGPRIRFGFAWTVVLVGAFALGPLAMALLLAVAGGATALKLEVPGEESTAR